MKNFFSKHGWWCMCLLAVSAFGQSNITRVEYFIDADPGYGNGTSITIPASNNIADHTFDINPAILNPGVHVVSIRAIDADGKWSYNYRWLIIKPYDDLEGPGSLVNITRVEYYIDADPGYGNGTEITISPGTNLVDQAFNINPISLSQGVHIVGLRARDANGNWSHDNRWLIIKPYDDLEGPGSQGNIVHVEYYIDTDPGYGNATPVTITAGTDLSDIQLNVNSGALTAGDHVLAIRSLDANGRWSHDNLWEFEVSSTLPVDLLNFGARYTNDVVVLDWKTASEQNASHFIVERSDNGISFIPVGKVAASGSSNAVRNYSFNDETAIGTGSLKLYYRLKQVDLDEKFEYSKIVSVTLPEQALFTVGPNPAANNISLRYRVSNNSGRALVQISDMNGKKVVEQSISAGTNMHTINIVNLAKGAYILTLIDKEARFTKRFVKQ
ncbi:T9SS type A sorting domain-containing protein [Terrimonas sp.]|uniref:T9SS type A sorting domain-containing protein n=1 Tax=Terrimonas sp. TaxID=1914338 RepID=UPI001056F017|nr:T9SS type A sorting domain-containing protein [Terrimonas sp.]